MKRFLVLCCILLVLTFISLAIGLSASADASDLLAIAKLIDDIPVLAPTIDRDNATKLEPVLEDYFGNPSTKVETKHELTKGFEEIVAFGYDPTLIYPGSVLQGKPLSDGGFIGVTLPRAPGVLTVSNLQFVEPANYSISVAKPAQSTIEPAVRKLISQKLAGEQAARISFARSEMFSLDQGFLSVGVNAKWLSGSVRASLQSETLKKRTSYVIRLTQTYYDISFERPTEPVGFFGADSKLVTAKKQMGADNPPTYISTVSYGRMLFVFFSSDESSEKLVASIDAAYSAGFGNLETNLKKEQLDVLKNSQLTVLALGGPSNAVVDVITQDKIKGLENYLKKGAVFSPESQAYPISYVVKHVRDGSIAKLGYTTNYSSTVYSLIPAIKSLLVHFHTHDDGKDADESVEMWLRDGTWGMKTIKVFGGQITIPDGTVTGSELGNGRWGQGHDWNKNTDQNFVINLNKPVPLKDCRNLRFRLRKHPDSDTGSGWEMSYQIRGLLFNGQSIPLFEQGERRIGDSNQYDFFNQGFSCP